MNNHQEEWAEESLVDMHEVTAKLWAKRWWIAASMAIFIVIFGIAAFVMTPVYRASILFVPAGAERNSMSESLNSALGTLGGLASLAGVRIGGNDLETEEALAVLRSRQFTVRFIEDRQLLPVLFAKRWDASAGKWKADGKEPPTLAKAYRRFDRDVRSVNQDKKTGLVTLQIDWKDRRVAAEWANDLIARLNAEMRARAIAKAEASLGFLEKELISTSVLEIRDAINRLMEAQIKQRMVANVTREFSFRVVDIAAAPDADDPVKPHKVLLLFVGALLGAVVGMLLVLLAGSFGRSRD